MYRLTFRELNELREARRERVMREAKNLESVRKKEQHEAFAKSFMGK